MSQFKLENLIFILLLFIILIVIIWLNVYFDNGIGATTGYKRL